LKHGSYVLIIPASGVVDKSEKLLFTKFCSESLSRLFDRLLAVDINDTEFNLAFTLGIGLNEVGQSFGTPFLTTGCHVHVETIFN
jgi:hypothetical protein